MVAGPGMIWLRLALTLAHSSCTILLQACTVRPMYLTVSRSVCTACQSYRLPTVPHLPSRYRREKDIPIDMLELPNKGEKIHQLAWEPRGHRFAILHGEGNRPAGAPSTACLPACLLLLEGTACPVWAPARLKTSVTDVGRLLWCTAGVSP
jgi:hypothetical protein